MPTSIVNMADFDLDSSFIPALHKPPALLHIAKHREGLLYLVETYQVVIVVGQTGSGKTTQIPQFLEKAGWCADSNVIAITQVSLPFPYLETLLIFSAKACSRYYGSPQGR